MSNFINPQSTCKLLNVKISKDYKNQYSFSSKDEQTNFFMTKSLSKDFIKLTFIRDGEITVEGQIYSLYNANYLMFQNSGFSNKWFYAFITDMKYVNQNTTTIYYEIDVFQSWYFDIVYHPTFIERKNVTDDSIGTNTIPENLQLGNYICNLKSNAGYGDDFVIILGSTLDYDLEKTDGSLYTNIYCGLRYYSFKLTEIQELNTLINNLTEKFGSETIVCLFYAPKGLISGEREDHVVASSNFTRAHYINNSNDLSNNTDVLISNNSLDGYKPKNNKLMCFPFRYLLVSNNSGIDVIYNYEDFYTKNENNEKNISNPSFKIEGCISPGCSIRMKPRNYKGIENNEEEAINLGKFPLLNWNTDYYQNWLRLNSVNVGLSVANGLTQIGVGYATGNPLTATYGLASIANSMAENYKASLIPAQVHGNINSGDIVTASNTNDFFFYDMSIKKEYAKIIDDYFSMFGYKVNTVEIPQLRTRLYWNYIETRQINITGNIPQDHLQKIKNMFDSGVTLWHDSDVGNYNRTNDIR